MKILILGVNGFIGHHLTRRILADTDWIVYGMDLSTERLEGLSFTLIRPFNWIGPKLDSLETAKEGSSRVVTQFIANLVMGVPIQLVDGGSQRRCFTYVDDGIDGLMKILRNEGACAEGGIFNIGHPDNDCSIRELAGMLRELFARHPRVRGRREVPPIVEVTAREYY